MNSVAIVSDDNPSVLLVQPVDSHDMEELETEAAYLRAHSPLPFRLVAMRVGKWNEELTPWPAPPVFGKTPFGDGAQATLDKIMSIVEKQKHFLSGNIQKHGDLSRVVLGGYSLAGLFALWASTSLPFGAIVSASPSVWYKDWLGYAETHPSLAPHVYLSLGDREHHSKTAIMATVNDCMNRQRDLLESQGIDTELHMNPGNHFQDNGKRTAMGFTWCIKKLGASINGIERPSASR